MTDASPALTPGLSRRALLGAAGGALLLPAWARGADLHHAGIRPGFDEVRGPDLALTIAAGSYSVAGRTGHAVAVNGSIPGPLVRLREGEKARIVVHNLLPEDSSIHWHGLLLPFQYDGVPGVSFPGIGPGERFTYEFPVRQAGTYWWHSHSGLQEQTGHYGPLIIDPAGPDPIRADRDYVLLLSEFTPRHPHSIMAKLKKGEAYFNRQQQSWTDAYPMTGAERRMWARMRMMPTDISDVGGATYTFLANGRGPADGPEFLFRPGERIRLRVINGSAMTFFNLRLPGLPMTVVAADGQPVRPVATDEVQIGVAETYDLILEPGAAPAYAIVAEAMDRSGMAVAMLANASGLRVPVPPLRPPPLLTMADMGMNHGEAGHEAAGHSEGDRGEGAGGMEGHGHPVAAPADHAGPDHVDWSHAGSMSADSGAAAPSASHGMAGMKMRDTTLLPPDVKLGPGIDMVSMMPVDKWDDPGVGLRDVPHRVLRYGQLIALTPGPDPRSPSRLLELHLTGNMERYMWSFDGEVFSAVSDKPIRFAWNERVRLRLVNDTMMAHPIHLHGMFVELVNGAPPGHQPRKHTLIVQPGASATVDLTADEPGDWAFHCHLLYHMHAGMFQIVTVMPPETAA
ncbi:MAG: copper-binding protein [Sphingobium sp. 66-54]|nr:MAG: copper-binding protein [Sphingobium sp. 66-54]